MKYLRDLLRDMSCSRSVNLMSIHFEISYSSLLKMTSTWGWGTKFKDGDNILRCLGIGEIDW